MTNTLKLSRKYIFTENNPFILSLLPLIHDGTYCDTFLKPIISGLKKLDSKVHIMFSNGARRELYLFV